MNRSYRPPNNHAKVKCSKIIYLLFFISVLLGAQLQAASVFTDRWDYPPGDTVHITGTGYWDNETVTVQITHYNETTPATADYDPWNVTANGFGIFETDWTIPDDALGKTLLVTAEGQYSGLIATTTFTDNNTVLTLTSVIDDTLCPGEQLEVCATLYEQCIGGTFTELENRAVLFFVNDQNCGVNVGQTADTIVYTDVNGAACANLELPTVPGNYTIRAKFLGESKPGDGEPPNSACDTTRRVQLAASNFCEEIVVDSAACNEPPVVSCPGDTTIFCSDLSEICIPGFDYSDPDNNLESVTVSLGYLNGNEVCFTPTGGGIYTIILIATDSLGQADTCETNVTVEVNSPPQVTCPGDTSLFVCNLQPICIPGFTVFDPDDNIDTLIVVGCELYGDTVCFNPVEGVKEIIFTAIDDCGEIDVCTTYVTVDLNSNPECVFPPNDTFIVCGDTTFNFPVYANDSDNNLDSCYMMYGPGVYSSNTWTFTTDGAKDYTAGFQCIDSCGSHCEGIVTITVIYNEPPEPTCPDSVTIQCHESAHPDNTGWATATDDNDPSPLIVYVDDTTAGSCPDNYTITRTWTVTDTCGASASCQQIITVIDTIPPTFTHLPPNITIECDESAHPDNTDWATATDNCATPVISYADDTTAGSCPDNYIITRTWMAEDDCENVSTYEQVITVQDTTPPTFTHLPPNITIECDESAHPDNTDWATATDNCATPVIDYVDDTTAGSCPDNYIITRTWTAEDDCENVSTYEQVITVQDTTPPEIECPDNITIECDQSIDPDSTGWATATDNCDPDPAITFSDSKNYGVITRTWVATDTCGNFSTCEQIITILDSTDPTIDCPDSVTIQCHESSHPDNTGWATATDNCDDTLDISYSDSLVDGNCPHEWTILRTWVALDDNGNSSDCIQVIAVIDTTPPPIICPQNVTVECDGSTHPDSTGWATATDSCDGDVDINYYDSGDPVITRTWVATDDCGNSDTCYQTITVIPNVAPRAICPDITTIFMCELIDTCLTGFLCEDDDGNLDRCETDNGVYNNGTVCFTPVEGSNTITLFAVDECGLVDSCKTIFTVVLNHAPAAADVDLGQISVCDLSELCLNVGTLCSDIDGNLTGCYALDGTYNGSTYCFTPVEGINTVRIEAIDGCAVADTGYLTIEVTLIEPPEVSCPGDVTRYVDSLPFEICVPGFVGELETIIGVGSGTFVGGEVCFIAPDTGIYTIIMSAGNVCGETVKCSTNVRVDVLGGCPTIVIEKTHNTLQGHFEYVSITMEDYVLEMGGFDFLIAYDASAITPIEATPGQLLEDCEWEYFTYRFGANGNCGNACPTGLLRIVAVSETNDGPNHPICLGPPNADPHELAVIRFYVTNDRLFECQYVPIWFFWGDCGDNSISSSDGNTLFIDHAIYDFEGNLIWDEDDDDQFPEDDRIPYVGAPDYCLNYDPNKPSAERCLDFVNGGIDIVCADSIDARGDVNLNGLANEVADAVVFTNYFIYGLEAFIINVEGQIAATDVNADGTALSVADLVYLIRVMVGDALAIPKEAPKVSVEFISSDGVISTNRDLGAVLIVLEGDVDVSLGRGAIHVEMLANFDGKDTRVLIYSFEKTESFGGEILNTKGRIVSAEAADYYGSSYKTGLLPTKFSARSYPNPFNPMATIELSLPIASDWNISIYNVTGRKVTDFNGHSEAGIVNVTWDASNYASGIYFYRVEAGTFRATSKMILIK